MLESVTSSDVLLYLQISVAIVLLIILYHVLFIVVDLRKILRRVDDVTDQVENVIMKPISVADNLLEMLVQFLESQGEPSKNKKKISKK